METPVNAGQERSGVLEGVRILDLGQYRACAEAALLLAELGAEVVKVRLAEDQGMGLTAVQAAIWDRSKFIIDIDRDSADGKAALADLLAGADVVLQDRTPSEMRRMGLDEATLCVGRNDLIFATIGSWPGKHENAECPVDDVLVLAEVGILDEQLPLDRDGPAFLSIPLGSVHAAFLAATGIIARLICRRRSSRGGIVETSLVQGALLPMMMYWDRAVAPTPSLIKGMPKQTPQTQYVCKDGKWMHVMGDPAKAPLVRRLLDEMGPDRIREANDRFYAGRPIVLPNIGALGDVFRQRTREEWLRELWQADVAVQPVAETGALFVDEQAHACGYVTPVGTTEFGRTLQAAIPIHLTPPPSARIGRPPAWPRRIADTTEITTTARQPLDGIRVIDFGNYLAGPLATMLLADLGADVIKVEAVGGEPMRHVEWAFNACQRGKRTIALDLSNPEAADVIRRLVHDADVVHHNQRMPTARKLGIDYDSLKAINPALVYTHVSAYGPSGPRKDWPGFDQLFQAASGWELEAAGEGNRPTWLRFGMMDHLAALASLLGTVAALYSRQRTGQGQQTAASLLGASLFTLDTAAREDGTLLPYPRLDRRQLGFSATCRLYQCSDGWIAVSSAKPEAFPRMLAAVQCRDERETEAMLASQSVTEAIATLKGAAISCVKVARENKATFFDDSRNRACRLIAEYPHPVYKRLEQIGALWDFGDLECALDRAPPTLGQHTREILRDAGYGPEDIDMLLKKKLVQAA